MGRYFNLSSRFSFSPPQPDYCATAPHSNSGLAINSSILTSSVAKTTGPVPRSFRSCGVAIWTPFPHFYDSNPIGRWASHSAPFARDDYSVDRTIDLAPSVTFVGKFFWLSLIDQRRTFACGSHACMHAFISVCECACAELRAIKKIVGVPAYRAGNTALVNHD